MSTPRRIYLDNAATSWPKPEAVYAAVDDYQRRLGAAAGRSSYRDAAEVEGLVAEARRAVAKLLNAPSPERIIFTANGTDGLNLGIQGILRPGDQVVTTDAEHNSVLRPLWHLEQAGLIRVTRVPVDKDGCVDRRLIAEKITQETRLVVLTAASNVTGTLQPVAAVTELAHRRGALVLLDAAQVLGHVPFDLKDLPVDLLAAPGHKGLFGPLGTGILYIAPSIEEQLRPIRQGGTGSQSHREEQPDKLPDRFESGNLNVPGIIGLKAGVEFLLERGLSSLRMHELELLLQLMEGLAALPKVKIFGPLDPTWRVGVVSVTLEGYDPQEAAAALDAAYGIQVRPGLHCAPRMHAALGTSETGGTIRFSFGPFTTERDIAAMLTALREMTETDV